MNLIRFFGGLLSLAVLVLGITTACSGEDTSPAPATVAQSSSSGLSATLRSDLNRLLAEHVYLAVAATSAALGGRAREFTAAATALDANSIDLSKTIGAAYGEAAEAAFLSGWRRHIGFFVEYTQGAATRDATKKAEAVAGLEQYARDLAQLLNSANGMAKADVVSIVGAHAVGLTAVIDAQAAGDEAKAFDGTRAAALHMHLFADPLAEATVRKFPDKFRLG